MNNPKVSIIVPVYNGEQYLHQCITSLLNQQLQEIEVILVDDGSTDHSPQICDDYAQRDSRIRVLHLVNQGVSHARNCGMDMALGQFIAFVDGDDWIDEGMYAGMLDMVMREQVAVVMCNYFRFNGEVNILDEPPWYKNTIFERLAIETQVIPALISPIDIQGKKQRVIGGAVWKYLFSGALLREHHLKFDTQMKCSEDLVFVLQALSFAPKMAFLDVAYYHYRQDVQQKTSTTQKHIKNIYANLKLSQQHIEQIIGCLDGLPNMTQQMAMRNIINVQDCFSNLVAEDSPYTLSEKIREAKYYRKDSKFRQSTTVVDPTLFTPTQKILVLLMKYSLVGIVVLLYTLKKKLDSRGDFR